MADLKILERVAALLSLSEGNANEHEAAAAMAAASRLMAQHSIDRASLDVLAAADPELEDVAIDDAILDAGSGAQCPTWRWALASGIAAAHGCSCYTSTVREYGGKRRTRIMILGTANDAGATRYLYAFAARQIEALCLVALRDNGRPGKSWGTNFRVAAADRVVARYREAFRRSVAQARASAPGIALARVDERDEKKAIALRAVIARREFITTAARRAGYDAHAHNAGRAAGDRVDLGTGSSRGALGAGAPRRMGAGS